MAERGPLDRFVVLFGIHEGLKQVVACALTLLRFELGHIHVLAERLHRDVGRFLRLFTDLPLDEIARLESLEGAAINEAKKLLANEATAILHGRAAAEASASTAATTFAGGAGTDLPTVPLSMAPNIVAANTALGFASSNKEAKRKLEEGAIRVNDVVVTDAAHALKHGLVTEG